VRGFAYLSEDRFRCRGEGPEFYSEAKAQVRAYVSWPDRCGTVPAGRKISTIATLTGSFALARERPPSASSAVGGQPGARSLSGGPDVSWPRPAGSPRGHTSPGRLLPLPAVAGNHTALHRPGHSNSPRTSIPVPPGTARIARDRRYGRNSVPGSFMTDKVRRVPRLCKRGRADPGQAARWISGRLRGG
jgi:hypothetical protein